MCGIVADSATLVDVVKVGFQGVPARALRGQHRITS